MLGEAAKFDPVIDNWACMTLVAIGSAGIVMVIGIT
jgi:hypothetical protein